MIHPHTELRFIRPEVGYGVVATSFIPKGTICWILDRFDQVFAPADVKAMHPLHKQVLSKYSFRDERGHHILCWDHARFVNHSFDSSLVSTAYGFELAARDIQPGEELTDDYGWLNLWEPFDCAPEPGIERTRVMPDDVVRHHEAWDAKAAQAFRSFHAVEQPLLTLLDDARLARVRAMLDARAPMESIRATYFAGGTDVFG